MSLLDTITSLWESKMENVINLFKSKDKIRHDMIHEYIKELLGEKIPCSLCKKASVEISYTSVGGNSFARLLELKCTITTEHLNIGPYFIGMRCTICGNSYFINPSLEFIDKYLEV